MKTDVQGLSTTPPGEERFEEYHSSAGWRVQFDWRAPDGRLFSCVAKTLEEARAKRDRWWEKCPGCGGRGTIRFWGAFPQTVGCEDCAGTGKRQPSRPASPADPEPVEFLADVFCDNFGTGDCAEWVHGGTGSRPDIREARQVAKANGWKRGKRGGRWVDLCPECAKKEAR